MNPNSNSNSEMEKFNQEQKKFNTEKPLNSDNQSDLKKVETLEVLDI